jgi:CBS domain-containing protein
MVSPQSNQADEICESLSGGHILPISSRHPIVAYPTSTVKQVSGIMVDHGIRRLPVVDAGSTKLLGIISATDLVDFFGGGEKYDIVKKDFDNNLFAAVNMHISKIMSEQPTSIKENTGIRDAAKCLLENRRGGCPVVDKSGKVIAVLSEVDLIKRMPESLGGVAVEDIMTKDVTTSSPDISLLEAAQLMVSKKLRRVPVLDKGEIIGMLRTMSVLKFISSNEFSRFGTIDADKILSDEKVGDAMSRHFTTIRPQDPVDDLLRMIVARRMGGFPVEENGKLVGIVTEHDIFKFAYS